MERDREQTQRPYLRGSATTHHQRLWRWCVMRTLRDGRFAKAKGKWIGMRNLERLASRRWWRWSDQQSPQDPTLKVITIDRTKTRAIIRRQLIHPRGSSDE